MIQSNHLSWNLFDVLHFEDIDGLGGAAQTLANPTGCDFQLVHLVTEFTTDANAADRQVYLELLAQTFVYRLAVAPVKQLANLTYTYIFSLGAIAHTSGDVLTIVTPLNPRLRIRQAHLLTLTATGIQAADQFTNTRTIRNAWQTV